MNPKIVYFLGWVLLGWNCFFSHSLQAQKPEFTVAFYNLENLFDTVDSPDTDDAEFLPSSGWSQERYRKKLNQLSRVIDTLGTPSGPDFLGVCEAENRLVLEDLVSGSLLKNKGYKVIHEESSDPRGIDVGFLYKGSNFKVLSHQAFRLFMPDTQIVRTRDVLWVFGRTKEKDTIGFFVCHWPSRRGGERADRYRQYIASRIREISDSLAVLYPGATWLLMGDLNDEPSDRSVRLALGALAPQDSACHQKNWFNPMAAIQEKGDGTHAYQQKWHVLDQILLKCAGMPDAGYRILDGSATVYRPQWMQSRHEKYFGEPYRTYAGKNYLGGFSDHFPVYVKIQKR
jgi:endonuclease/exonuclease/phosphatase family metal-dependent hydrolase